ncbi:transcription initiation protein SPT3 homolog [Neocloeon triangulifer]|uniref:transcription initiation protein SPT3 homolog n=1 Tax=Neocloeon triangulifer TaxID=2078957 RepID=UPI00286F3170|nr:transcription initiation protein SPT3 homolog [Neocloeon triangulifer]
MIQAEGKAFYFETEIQRMMYASGDSRSPLLETAHLIEEVVHKQMVLLLQKAQEVAELREAKYIRPEDMLFLMRKDRYKLRRAIKFLCFSDTKSSIYTDLVGNVEKKVASSGKRRNLCKDFLLSMDFTGQLMAWVDNDLVVDHIKEERLRRADEMSIAMSADEYINFSHARGVTFTQSNNNNTLKLREWIFNDGNFLGDASQPQLPLGHGIHMELLGYLAHETLCQLVDFALQVRRDCNASITNPMNRLLPPSLYVPMTIFKPHDPRYDAPSGKVEFVQPLTPHDVREAVRRFTNPVTPFNRFSRGFKVPVDQVLFCC